MSLGLLQVLKIHRLKIRSPFIEAYLSSPPQSIQKFELLWQYHVRSGSYGKAATVQAGLAQSLE